MASLIATVVSVETMLSTCNKSSFLCRLDTCPTRLSLLTLVRCVGRRPQLIFLERHGTLFSSTIYLVLLQMFDSIGKQASLGLAAGCCLIGSAMAELDADNPDVQEKQVGIKKRRSSSHIIEMHCVVIESHPSNEEVHSARSHRNHSSLHDHQTQPLGSQSQTVEQVSCDPYNVLEHLQSCNVSTLITCLIFPSNLREHLLHKQNQHQLNSSTDSSNLHENCIVYPDQSAGPLSG